MGIWDRLGNVIKSYLNDGETSPERDFSSRDPDLDAAFEELNEFLAQGPARERAGRTFHHQSSDANSRGQERGNFPSPPPESLRADFAELGLPFGASAEECKAAYKKLLKIHHPDRHAGHEGNTQKATDKSARLNAAYDRIEKWRAQSRG